jgi:hypothetical protein
MKQADLNTTIANANGAKDAFITSIKSQKSRYDTAYKRTENINTMKKFNTLLGTVDNTLCKCKSHVIDKITILGPIVSTL